MNKTNNSKLKRDNGNNLKAIGILTRSTEAFGIHNNSAVIQ